jgi:hypothetical protein
VHESKVGKQKLPIHGHVIDDTRFSMRNVHKNMENVLDRVANMTRKRNLEGNPSTLPEVNVNSFLLC